MFPTNVLASLSPGELMALVVRLQEQVGQLSAANEELRKEITQLKHSGKRQAAPPTCRGNSEGQSQAPWPPARQGVVQLPKAAVSR